MWHKPFAWENTNTAMKRDHPSSAPNLGGRWIHRCIWMGVRPRTPTAVRQSGSVTYLHSRLSHRVAVLQIPRQVRWWRFIAIQWPLGVPKLTLIRWLEANPLFLRRHLL